MSSALVVGIATTTVLSCVALTGALGMVPTVHQLRATADAAALAAADATLWLGEAEPCELALRLVEQHRYSLSACDCSQASCTVTVSTSVAGIPLVVAARAG